jgi:hypothetical protein
VMRHERRCTHQPRDVHVVTTGMHDGHSPALFVPSLGLAGVGKACCLLDRDRGRQAYRRNRSRPGGRRAGPPPAAVPASDSTMRSLPQASLSWRRSPIRLWCRGRISTRHPELSLS